MILQKFSVTGQHIERTSSLNLVADSRNFIQFQFEFSAEWSGVNKTAIITTGGTSYNCVIDADGSISLTNMPTLVSGLCSVSVFGGDLFTTDSCAMTIYESGMKNGTTPPVPPPDIYSQILTKASNAETRAVSAENLANDTQNKATAEARSAGDSAVAAGAAAAAADAAADAAGNFMVDAAGSAQRAKDTVAAFDSHAAAKTTEFDGNAQTKTAAFDSNAVAETKLVTDEGTRQVGLVSAEGTRQVGLVSAEGTNQTAAAKVEADKAAGSAVAAKASETQADASEAEALLSQQKAQQALADLLKIIGVDIATLVGGKIPMSQIPATATQEIYTVTSEAELVGLTAQRGDLAELITMVGGVKTITKTWQLLGTSTVATDWVLWGTAYAVSAGNASTAGNADNAGMINNHRMVEMRQADFDTAVKDTTTYYLVTA